MAFIDNDALDTHRTDPIRHMSGISKTRDRASRLLSKYHVG